MVVGMQRFRAFVQRIKEFVGGDMPALRTLAFIVCAVLTTGSFSVPALACLCEGVSADEDPEEDGRDRQPGPQPDVEFEGYPFHACHVNLEESAHGRCVRRYGGQGVWWFKVTRAIKGSIGPGPVIVHADLEAAACGIKFRPCRVVTVRAFSRGNHLLTDSCNVQESPWKIVPECLTEYPPEHWEGAFLTCNETAPTLDDLCPRPASSSPPAQSSVPAASVDKPATSTMPQVVRSHHAGGCGGCSIGCRENGWQGLWGSFVFFEMLLFRRVFGRRIEL